MTDKPATPTSKPEADQVKDLPPKKISRQDEENTKGGRRGPGTQTEDEVYIG